MGYVENNESKFLLYVYFRIQNRAFRKQHSLLFNTIYIIYDISACILSIINHLHPFPRYPLCYIEFFVVFLSQIFSSNFDTVEKLEYYYSV